MINLGINEFIRNIKKNILIIILFVAVYVMTILYLTRHTLANKKAPYWDAFIFCLTFLYACTKVLQMSIGCSKA